MGADPSAFIPQEIDSAALSQVYLKKWTSELFGPSRGVPLLPDFWKPEIWKGWIINSCPKAVFK